MKAHVIIQVFALVQIQKRTEGAHCKESEGEECGWSLIPHSVHPRHLQTHAV